MEPAAKSAPESADRRRRRPRVIIVDDNRDTVLTLGILFRSEGYMVRMLENGAVVEAAVRSFRPNVVLLDLGMPKRNGYDIAQALRSRFGAECPVLVAVTAHNTPEERLQAERSGFQHHVAKPYEPMALVQLVNSVILRGASR